MSNHTLSTFAMLSLYTGRIENLSLTSYITHPITHALDPEFSDNIECSLGSSKAMRGHY